MVALDGGARGGAGQFNEGRSAGPWLIAAILLSPIVMLPLVFIIPVKLYAQERRRSRAALLNTAAVAVVLVCMISVIHSSEVENVHQALASILADKFKNNDTRVKNVRYPFY